MEKCIPKKRKRIGKQYFLKISCKQYDSQTSNGYWQHQLPVNSWVNSNSIWQGQVSAPPLEFCFFLLSILKRHFIVSSCFFVLIASRFIKIIGTAIRFSLLFYAKKEFSVNLKIKNQYCFFQFNCHVYEKKFTVYFLKKGHVETREPKRTLTFFLFQPPVLAQFKEEENVPATCP